MSDKAVRLAASFFYVGYAPFWPGFWGSLAAIALVWFFPAYFYWLFIPAAVIGFLICAPAQKAFAVKDPGKFVLDEVFGMCACLIGLPHDLAWFAAAFLIYRLFDVWKPWWIGAVDRMGRPSAIMWDDLAAAAPTIVILQGAQLIWF